MRGFFNDACMIFFSDVLIKAFVVGSHLNCLYFYKEVDKSILAVI